MNSAIPKVLRDMMENRMALRYSLNVLDSVCKGLGGFPNWSDFLGRRLLKKEDQSPSVFLKSWTETFLLSNKVIMSYRQKQQGLLFSALRYHWCPLVLVGF